MRGRHVHRRGGDKKFGVEGDMGKGRHAFSDLRKLERIAPIASKN